VSRYLAGAIALTVFGFLAGFSLGPGLFLLGIVLLALTPVRTRAALFWPPVAAALAWVGAWYASAPLRCTATDDAGSTAAQSVVTCFSLLGVTSPDPPAMLNAAAGFAAAAAVTAFVTALVILRTRQTRRSTTPP
jgi:hypothetical protein